uniref:Uncharacterized protein n=1 Tax=Rhizophora mucronata TaxID=61149 RepID=A0A2P2Q1U4_RHIMU
MLYLWTLWINMAEFIHSIFYVYNVAVFVALCMNFVVPYI